MAAPGQVQTLTVMAKELGPWSPDISARRFEKPSIVTGRNFKDEPDGPMSAWGSNIINFNFWGDTERQKVVELRITNDILYGTNSGVWRINKTSGVAEPILLVTVTRPFWPWTIAYVGGLYYIAQYDIGLWQFDPDNNTLAHVATLSSDVVRYVAESNGRLIYLSDTDIWVSSLDDGTDFTPSLTTAAGAQPLSLVGGIGYSIVSILDGFLVYTSNGILRASYTQAAYVFAYKPLKTHVRVWSPNATIYIPKVGSLSLDSSGFSITKETTYTDPGNSDAWEILMGDYVKKNILAFMDNTLDGTMQLYWSEAEQKLFVSFSSNDRQGLMITTFVWSAVVKKWMPMDHQHTGVFETYSAINNIYTCGYMATDGYMRAFNNADYSDDLPAYPYTIADLIYRTEMEEPILAEISTPGGSIFHLGTTDINISEANPNAYKNFVPVAGLFTINSEPFSNTNNDNSDDPDMVIGPVIVGGTYINMDISGGVELFAIGYSLPSIGLDSEISIGPYRFNDQIQPDESSALSTVLLELTATSTFTITEDWNILVGNEDWNALNGNEDWGAGTVVPNMFDLILRSSSDGINEPFQGDEDLVVFNDNGSLLDYRPYGTSGLYHGLRLVCSQPGQSYALKVIGLSGQLTGRVDAQL